MISFKLMEPFVIISFKLESYEPKYHILVNNINDKF